MSAAERAHLARPFAKGLLERARKLASSYRLVIESDPDGGYIGSTVELPFVMGGGRTVQACVADVMEATAGTIAYMLESGQTPPAPAAEGKRDQQVNIRLSAEEKFRLEDAANRLGFRSLSDFMRAAAMRGMDSR